MWLQSFKRSTILLGLLTWGGAACDDAEQLPCGGPCAQGVCDEAIDECVDPWLLSCPLQTNECSADRPFLCDSAGTPAYDCSTCGCPGDEVCEVGVCYAPETLALERSTYGIPTDLPIDEYFKLYDYAMTAPALSYSEFVEEVDALLRADGRRTTLLLGESHNSSDEQAVGLQLIRDLVGLGWPLQTMGIEGDPGIIVTDDIADLGISSYSFGGNLTNAAHCADAVGADSTPGLNFEGMHVQYTGSGHTSQEVCQFNTNWSICQFPHTAECITATGRKSVTLILLDPDPWLWQTDNTLSWRIDTLPDDPMTFETELNGLIARWKQSFDGNALQPEDDYFANGQDVNVRIVRAGDVEDVFIAYFPRPNRPAYFAQGYHALWQVPELQTALIANGIGPKRCSVSWMLAPGAERITLNCQRNGYAVSGTVDGVTFELLQSSHGPA